MLDVEEGKESYIIGTVFCENIDRPNVFEEVENDQVNIQFSLNLTLIIFFRFQLTKFRKQ